MRAFEILTGTFVLGLLEDSENVPIHQEETLQGQQRTEYITTKKMLKLLIGPKIANDKLRMFLTGPGGSGKSEVINQLITYSQEFCARINFPFTTNTILVTACLGVTATLIHGQTLHSVTFLNRRGFKNIPEEEATYFCNTVRMIIIDEISLLNPEGLRELDKKLNFIMQTPAGKFGNLHVAFMGDFQQLYPPDSTINEEFDSLVHWKFYINCFIELQEMYRFKDDMRFGECLLCF